MLYVFVCITAPALSFLKVRIVSQAELRGKRFRKHRKWCHTFTNYDIIFTPPMTSQRFRKRFLPNYSYLWITSIYWNGMLAGTMKNSNSFSLWAQHMCLRLLLYAAASAQGARAMHVCGVDVFWSIHFFSYCLFTGSITIVLIQKKQLIVSVLQ